MRNGSLASPTIILHQHLITNKKYLHFHPKSLNSDPEEVDAELGSAIAVRVHHVERLRVAGPHDALEPRPHVHDVALGRGYDPGAHGHGLQRAEHAPVRGAALAPHRVPAALAVAVGAPHRLLHQLLVGVGALALQRDAHQPRRHLAHQRRRGRGQLQQQRRARARVHLERQVHVPAPVAVQRAGEPRAHADLPVPAGHGIGQCGAEAPHGRPDFLPPLRRRRCHLQRRGHQVLRVEGQAGGGEGYGGLVVLRVHELGVPDRGAVASALAKNRPLQVVPPGE
jgi:hypothetical protein